MALKLRKDIKKSSYYVWFLGAKESKGLRGSEYILPVIKHLEEREKDVEPFKVTLQVSHKGLKIIQNIQTNKVNSTKPKQETIKHFIPHNTITCCYQHDDVIACILLLFNPVTKCPLHIHAYRCDSLETATLLKQQLQILIDRPENQKKFAEIESRLRPAPIAPVAKKIESSVGSDTGTSTRESESSSEERYGLEPAKVTCLYDSVAAELREKLSKNNVPILLPPRDYDTVHRQKGNLTGIELRRCLNTQIVGQNVVNNNNNHSTNNNNNHSTNNNNNNRRIESSGGSSGIGSDHPPSPDSPDTSDMRFNTMDNQSTSDEDWNGDPAESTIYLMHGPPQVTLPRPSSRDGGNSETSRFSRYTEKTDITKYLEQPIAKFSQKTRQQSQLPPTQSHQSHRSSMRRSDNDYREPNYRHFGDEERNYSLKDEFRKGYEKGMKYFNDDGFDENLRYRIKSPDAIPKDYRQAQEPPVPRTRQKIPSQSQYKHQSPPSPSYLKQKSPSPSYPRDIHLRQRSPSPESLDDLRVSSHDRFKDAKEKFLSMEREEVLREPLISPTITKEKPFLKRHESMAAFESRHRSNTSHEVKYRHHDMERYNRSKYEPKRHSMLNLIEEEHKRHSNEIAQELKRRSYIDKMQKQTNNNISKSTIDLNQVDMEPNRNYHHTSGSNSSRGYRHSYAEPKMKIEKEYSRGSRKKNFDNTGGRWEEVK